MQTGPHNTFTGMRSCRRVLETILRPKPWNLSGRGGRDARAETCTAGVITEAAEHVMTKVERCVLATWSRYDQEECHALVDTKLYKGLAIQVTP